MFWATFALASRALLRNKLRSFLTVLGVVIGTASLVTMVAVGEGAKVSVESAFASMGTNLLIVSPGAQMRGGISGGAATEASLTWDDLEAMSTVAGVRGISPSLRETLTVVSEMSNWATSVRGVTPDYFVVRDWSIDRGEGLIDTDVRSSTKRVVLGATVSRELFGTGADPVGQRIRIGKVPFDVIGVAAVKGMSAMGSDNDDAVFVPATTFLTKLKGGPKDEIRGAIFIGGRSEGELPRIEREITQLLRERHGIGPDDQDDFNIRNLSELARAQEEGTRVLTALLASVALVALLVGGIGIMNIMLVSVTERTREIGIRLAVGARPLDILVQFLIEAIVLSLLGGFIGIGIGMGTAQVLAERFKWPLMLDVSIIVLALGFSAAVGVVFGLYPARRAAAMNPIRALRFE